MKAVSSPTLVSFAWSRVGRKIIEAFEIYGSRVTTPAGTGIAADVESGPCERGGIDGRWERQNDQAGKAKTQSSILVHGCSPATDLTPPTNLKHCFGRPTVTFLQQARGFSLGRVHAPRSATAIGRESLDRLRVSSGVILIQDQGATGLPGVNINRVEHITDAGSVTGIKPLSDWPQ